MSDQFSGTKDVADNLAFSLDNLNSYLELACPEVEKIKLLTSNSKVANQTQHIC